MKSLIPRALIFLLAILLLMGILPGEFFVKEVFAADLSTDLYQLPPQVVNYKGISYGNMSYIIRTRNGKIIVIDGGYSNDFMDDDVHSDSAYLLSQLKKITGKAVPNVDAWFFTHMHADHVGAFKDLVANQQGKFTVSTVYYRFPTDAEIEKYCPVANHTAHKNMVQSFKNHVAICKNAKGEPTQTVTLTSRFDNQCNGSFDIDTVHFDVLMTCEDVFRGADTITTKYSGNLNSNGKAYTSKTIKELVHDDFGNNTTAVFRMTVGGKTVLFLGDAAEPEGILLRIYHEKHAANSNEYFSLKSDIVQMAHHGQNGVPRNVYTAINPDIALWPTADWLYEVPSTSEYTTYYTRQWMSALGTTNYVAKDGLKKISFPDLRTAEQPQIPEEMKPFIFDPVYYVEQYPALQDVFGTDEAKLYAHFLKYGVEEGRCASPYFDVKYYTTQNSLQMLEYCRGDYEKALNHFLIKAYEEGEFANAGKKLSPSFDCEYYKNTYPELLDLGIKTEFDLLKYYATTGKELGHITAREVITLDGTVYHPVADIGAVSPTCTASGLTVGKQCATCNKVLVKQETVASPGHDYAYTVRNGMTHMITCENCDFSETAPHAYTYGFCICGEPEIKDPMEYGSLKLNHSLNLASDISVNFLVSKTLLEGFDMDTVYVESIVETPTGATALRIDPVENGNYYYFILDGLTAVQMNDRISSVLYGIKDGQPYYSPVDEYSIATYAYSQMNNPDRDESLKTLCADLLRYGAKAQIFKNYRTDCLADGNMTETHKAYLSDMEAVTFGNTNKVLNDLDNAPITWAGKVLNLESKVALKLVFYPGAYEGDLSALTLRISYEDAEGNAKSCELKNAELYNESLGYYVFTLDTLLAAELRSVISAQIYVGQTPVSCTLQYSPDTYGNGKTGTLLDLCKALFAYSDSARAYFG